MIMRGDRLVTAATLGGSSSATGTSVESGFRARVPVIMRRVIDRDIAAGGSGVNLGARTLAMQTGLPYNTARRVLRERKLSPPTMRVLMNVYARDGETVLDLFVFIGDEPPE
jgi:hypothetical protein